MTTALQTAKNNLAELESRQDYLNRALERCYSEERGRIVRDLDIVEREIATAKATVAACERFEQELAQLAS